MEGGQAKKEHSPTGFIPPVQEYGEVLEIPSPQKQHENMLFCLRQRNFIQPTNSMIHSSFYQLINNDRPMPRYMGDEGSEIVMSSTQPIFVSNETSMNEMLMYIQENIDTFQWIAFHVECFGSRTYTRQLPCLFQLSIGRRDYIIDLFPTFNLVMTKLKVILENQDILKVVHGGTTDFGTLLFNFGIQLTGFVDTNCLYDICIKNNSTLFDSIKQSCLEVMTNDEVNVLISRLDGQQISLNVLVNFILHKQKGENSLVYNPAFKNDFQTSDWIQRKYKNGYPVRMPDEKMVYARGDTHLLSRVFNTMLKTCTSIEWKAALELTQAQYSGVKFSVPALLPHDTISNLSLHPRSSKLNAKQRQDFLKFLEYNDDTARRWDVRPSECISIGLIIRIITSESIPEFDDSVNLINEQQKQQEIQENSISPRDSQLRKEVLTKVRQDAAKQVKEIKSIIKERSHIYIMKQLEEEEKYLTSLKNQKGHRGVSTVNQQFKIRNKDLIVKAASVFYKYKLFGSFATDDIVCHNCEEQGHVAILCHVEKRKSTLISWMKNVATEGQKRVVRTQQRQSPSFKNCNNWKQSRKSNRKDPSRASFFIEKKKLDGSLPDPGAGKYQKKRAEYQKRKNAEC